MEWLPTARLSTTIAGASEQQNIPLKQVQQEAISIYLAQRADRARSKSQVP